MDAGTTGGGVVGEWGDGIWSGIILIVAVATIIGIAIGFLVRSYMG